MTLFRPSVPKVPRDEAVPSGEVSAQSSYIIQKLMIYRNAKLAVDMKTRVSCLSASRVTTHTMAHASILLSSANPILNGIAPAAWSEMASSVSKKADYTH